MMGLNMMNSQAPVLASQPALVLAGFCVETMMVLQPLFIHDKRGWSCITFTAEIKWPSNLLDLCLLNYSVIL